MAWITENRRTAVLDQSGPYLTDEIRAELSGKYFPRYPTKRAVLLPALHAVQHAHGWLPMRALEEIAEFLEISPAEVLDTVTFYEEYWLKPKGKYLIQVCRSLSCEICGSRELTKLCEQKLGIELGETTADGRYTLVELECLGACGTAPVAMVNEVLHEDLTPRQLDTIISGLPEDPADHLDASIPAEWQGHGHHHGGARVFGGDAAGAGGGGSHRGDESSPRDAQQH